MKIGQVCYTEIVNSHNVHLTFQNVPSLYWWDLVVFWGFLGFFPLTGKLVLSSTTLPQIPVSCFLVPGKMFTFFLPKRMPCWWGIIKLNRSMVVIFVPWWDKRSATAVCLGGLYGAQVRMVTYGTYV